MIWQPEFTDKTLSRKPGAVHGDCAQHFRHARKEGHVAFFGLVGVVDFDIHQHFADLRFQTIPMSDGGYHTLNGHIMPGHLTFNVKFIPKICASG
ncbi:hypothetical protein [Escherichia coli]|uniref:hypothetical protein n=1 Tax=Escherichia coli TaxID=562 RepID=UPI0039F122E6